MVWIERFNKAITFIEENIADDISIDQVADIACCSTFHFQRIFSFITNISISEYIRRRKMTLAASDVLEDKMKIIDISLKYGYSSPTAFNRAFKSIHNVAPSQARNKGIVLKSFPPISFQLTVKGVEEMNFKIEKLETFRIIGTSIPLYKDIERNFEIVPQMWQKVSTEGTLPKLVSLMQGPPIGILGISCCGDNDEWRYYISVANKENTEFEEYIVPANTWAIFTGGGQCPKAIQDLERRIITEWLPSSGYEYANGPDIEVYLNDDIDNAEFEVWIPVIKS